MSRSRRRPAGRASGRSLRGTSTVRLRVGLLAITMVLSLFGARLFQIQGVDPKEYAAMAAASGSVTVDLPATRGDIVDRSGAPLAESVTGLMIVADPTKTKANAEEIAQILAAKLDLDYFDVLAKLRGERSQAGARFAYIARRIPSTPALNAVAAINKLKDEKGKPKYAGIATRPDPLRDYPAGDVAANMVGFLDVDGNPLAGLEQTFNKVLRGKDGSESYEKGGNNRIPLGDNTTVKPVNGKDLKLTIDRDVQWYAQRVLRSAVQGANADSGSAIAMDTQTGEILALADYPSYDANKPGQSPKGDRVTRSLSNVYEPGSVEKVLTSSSLIDLGKITPETKITVPKNLPVLDRVIHDYFDHPTMRWTLAGVIAQSSNIGTVLAATKFDQGQLQKYLSNFGLGHRFDIGMPGQARGVVPQGDWSSLTRATIAFGQGLSVTALQMATAVNTIANHGELVTPSLIQGKVTTNAGVDVGTETATRTQVVSPEAAAQTAQMMEMVTTEGAGTAPGAKVPGYRTAGKTGTAQQVGSKCRCYDGTLSVSFAGFAPADNPRFTVYVVIHNPRVGNPGGGWLAGPVFRKVMAYMMQKYAVPPTDTTPAALATEW